MLILGNRTQIVSCTFRIWKSCHLRQIYSRTFILSPGRKKLWSLARSETVCTTMSREPKPLSAFKFTDYDCIGFDLDNTLSRYKVGAMIEMEYEVMAKYLIEKKGYSGRHLLQPFDHNFILRGLIVDNENGNILRISSDGYILQASHGTKMLQDEEIANYYPNRHWKVTDIFVQDPLTTWNGPYSEKMRTLLDYFDIATSLVFARAVDTVDEENSTKGNYTVWLDIQESLQHMFNRENFQPGIGGYFEKMKGDPSNYYYKCSAQLIKWLQDLRQQNKRLFLLTGSHVDFASHTASNTLGPKWRELFDIVVCFAKKPGFFTMRRQFLKVEGIEETSPVPLEDLEIGGLYTHGNWTDIKEFLSRSIKKKDPKFLYIGDNLIQDVYTPHIHSQCDTVAVCEELEAEGAHGFDRWHPDQQFLVSTVWGSYFHCNNVDTNWLHLMKKHSRLSIPSLEYVAALPLDHEFRGHP